jgi:hypothetical protein
MAHIYALRNTCGRYEAAAGTSASLLSVGQGNSSPRIVSPEAEDTLKTSVARTKQLALCFVWGKTGATKLRYFSE